MSTSRLSTLTVLLAVSFLAACEAETQDAAASGPTSTGGQPAQETRQIDWTAARQARIASIEAGKTNGGLVSVASEGSGSPVPIMLPSGIVMPQNARPAFAIMDDGYFASYQQPKYDIIVNGTNEVFDTPAMDADAAAREQMVFTPSEAGAQVSFSRFGADYLVEFECRVLDGDTHCISREDALKIAEELFVAATE